MAKKISITGSGIGGIATAIRLAAKGYRVTVFEKESTPGGKISEKWLGGFRFDMGPSLLTMPWLVDELFELAEENPRDHFSFSKIPASCKYFWEDKTVLNAWSDPREFAREAATTTGVSEKKVIRALKKSQELFDLTSGVFLYNDIRKPENLLKKEFLKALFNIHRLDAFTKMHMRNQKNFQNPHIVQLFDRYATYNGSSPFATPATLNMIAHLEHNTGAYFPDKGMYSIILSLKGLAERMGVKFLFNSNVQKINIEKRTVKNIRVNDNFHESDIVINNVDVITSYHSLLRGETQPSGLLKRQLSSSALIFYWGISRTYPELGLHNILFSSNYRQEFDHLFQTHTISSDPTVYIFISSRNVPGDAPAGMENWYVMINAPENNGQPWQELVVKARRDIIKKINRILNTNIEDHIICEALESPVSIEKRTGSYHGSLYGISSNAMTAAFKRHPNSLSRFKNLYFTGGSVHPGGGIPLCLASARIIDKEIKPAT